MDEPRRAFIMRFMRDDPDKPDELLDEITSCWLIADSWDDALKEATMMIPALRLYLKSIGAVEESGAGISIQGTSFTESARRGVEQTARINRFRADLVGPSRHQPAQPQEPPTVSGRHSIAKNELDALLHAAKQGEFNEKSVAFLKNLAQGSPASLTKLSFRQHRWLVSLQNHLSIKNEEVYTHHDSPRKGRHAD